GLPVVRWRSPGGCRGLRRRVAPFRPRSACTTDRSRSWSRRLSWSRRMSPATMTHHADDDEKPLDPALIRIQARLRRMMLIAGLTLGLGILAVFGAILYR